MLVKDRLPGAQLGKRLGEQLAPEAKNKRMPQQNLGVQGGVLEVLISKRGGKGVAEMLYAKYRLPCGKNLGGAGVAKIGALEIQQTIPENMTL